MERYVDYQEAVLDLEEFDTTIKDLFKEKKDVDARLLKAYNKTYKFCKQIEGVATPDFVKFIKATILDKFNTNKIFVDHRDILDNYIISFNMIDPFTKEKRQYACEFNGELDKFSEKGIPGSSIRLLSERLESTTFARMDTHDGESVECPEVEKAFYDAYKDLCQRRFEDDQKGELKPLSYYLDQPEFF